MRQIHVSQLKAQCIFYAAEQDMEIETLDNETFKARGGGSVIHVDLRHLYDQVQNGWEVMETLQNETNYDPEYFGEES